MMHHPWGFFFFLIIFPGSIFLVIVSSLGIFPAVAFSMVKEDKSRICLGLTQACFLFVFLFLLAHILAYQRELVRFIQQAQERPGLPVDVGNKEGLPTGHK